MRLLIFPQTQINLLKDFLIDRGMTVDIVREPGSTTSGEAIRNILVDSGTKLYHDGNIVDYSFKGIVV